MLVAASAGLVANAIGLWLLRRGQAESLNLRGAYLEVLGDLLGSVAVLVAAVVIALTRWTAVDPVVSVVIALLIAPRTWSLLREAVDPARSGPQGRRPGGGPPAPAGHAGRH